MTIADQPGTAQMAAIRFTGRRRAYTRILVRGAVLLMVTLGLYRFWLTTDVRRFLWANTEIDGDGLEYTGTPLELLIGFLIAIMILIPVYTGFFIAAFDLGPVGQISGLASFGGIALLGLYAAYRARRYRLSRTVFRGLRFHLEGSAWAYALRASLWWIATALTLGLAYPFQLASLERFKMRHTFYGELGGSFTGSGLRLFLRGMPMWLVVMAPLAVAAVTVYSVIDQVALAMVLGSDDLAAGLDPLLAGAAGLAVLMAAVSILAAALLFPAFQALVLRWWTSGLRFGPIAMQSALRTRAVYGAWLRFLWYAGLFTVAAGIAAVPVLAVAGALAGGDDTSLAGEVIATVTLLAAYVIMALGFSTIYRATVMFSLWQLGMESLQLTGLSALDGDGVAGKGHAASPLGEGLADALNVGGY